MKIHYINLARREDRKQHFLAINQGIADFDHVKAVDGSTLDFDQVLDAGLVAPDLTTYTHGALGCAWTHMLLWKYAIARNETITIAEDDAVFNRNFSQLSSKLLDQLPQDMDFVLWGWNFNSILCVELLGGLQQALMHFTNKPMLEKMSEFQNSQLDCIAMKLLFAFGIPCYSISPKGAAQLINACFPLKACTLSAPALQEDMPNFGIDVAMNHHYAKLSCYACWPPLVVTENDKSQSDIQRDAV